MMVKELLAIVFPNLLTLSLIHNGIISLEPLVGMTAPRLEKIHLSRNHIRKVSPLRKAHFPHLIVLILNDNPIVDCQSLFQANFSCLEFLILENWDDSNSIGHQESLFKLSSSKLAYLGLKSARRIERSVMAERLRGKVKEVNLCDN